LVKTKKGIGAFQIISILFFFYINGNTLLELIFLSSRLYKFERVNISRFKILKENVKNVAFEVLDSVEYNYLSLVFTLF
jgi:hypothetical protein